MSLAQIRTRVDSPGSTVSPAFDDDATKVVASTGEPNSVQVIDRLTRILDCFSVGNPRLRAADVAARTGLPSSTVARLMRTLVDRNILQREGALHSIGLRVTAWSAAANAGSDLLVTAGPLLTRLRDTSGESCGLYVRQGTTRVSVFQVESQKSIVYRGYVGQVMPLSAGAAGKVFMAFDPAAHAAVLSEGLAGFTEHSITSSEALAAELDVTRGRGWAFSAQEREEGLNSLAAPVFDAAGQIVAAVAVGGPSFRLTAARAQSLATAVTDCARLISSGMHWAG
jgi:DNA-binding IclR family transcriptional regulator